MHLKTRKRLTESVKTCLSSTSRVRDFNLISVHDYRRVTMQPVAIQDDSVRGAILQYLIESLAHTDVTMCIYLHGKKPKRLLC